MASKGLKTQLIPAVSIFDVYNTVVRDLIEKRQELPDGEKNREESTSFADGLYFKRRSSKEVGFLPELLDRKDVDEISKEAVRLSTSLQKEWTDIVESGNPPIVLLDIPKDLTEYENRYNWGSLPAADLWTLYYREYYEPEGDDAFAYSEREFYKKYMRKAIEHLAHPIETESGRRRKIMFYDVEKEKRNRIVEVYEDMYKDGAAFMHDIITICRTFWPDMEVPNGVFYTGMGIKKKAIFYEIEPFYREIGEKMEELLKSPIKKHKLAGATWSSARNYVESYETFLETKKREDKAKIRNVYDCLETAEEQVEGMNNATIPVICGNMHYVALYEGLAGLSVKQDDRIEALIRESRPFYLKNTLMQKNYYLALQLLNKKCSPDPAKLDASECITPDALKYRKAQWLSLRI